MTMKISDQAVDTVQRWSWKTHTFTIGWGPVEGIIRRAFEHFAAHPEQLPEGFYYERNER